jgi:hypothetical protein
VIKVDLDAAVAELRIKSDAQIELETAQKWANRAVAAYYLHARALDAKDRSGATKSLIRAVRFEHEALEHAAEADELPEVRAAIEAAKRRWGVP